MTHSMREIMQIVEGSLDTKMRPTPEDLERIRQIREEVRAAEGGGGMCHFVSEIIYTEFGWSQAGGTVTAPNGDVMIAAHRWNELPDGAILDATADQLGQGQDIRIIEPNDPLHKCYRLEWDVDYNPGMADQYPELKGVEWNGEEDFDHQDRLAQERGRYWYVTDKAQHDAYRAQQRQYGQGKEWGYRDEDG